MDKHQALRPLERRVIQLVDDGMATSEIARRFRRSPAMIDRIIGMATLPGRTTGAAAREDVLRPVERRVLRWRDEGADYHEIGERFRRSGASVKRVEELARYKLEHA
jgi:DNA-binding CsgD family transcriptional regulator